MGINCPEIFDLNKKLTLQKLRGGTDENEAIFLLAAEYVLAVPAPLPGGRYIHQNV